jgi:hypothetical protein
MMWPVDRKDRTGESVLLRSAALQLLSLSHRSKRRQLAPGLIVSRKAFGPGRRVPIAQRWRG